jgi:hypothetical protein
VVETGESSPNPPREDAMDQHDNLSPAETSKDTIQSTVDVTSETVARVTSIVTGAVRDVARTLGDYGTELFEIRDAARRARHDS